MSVIPFIILFILFRVGYSADNLDLFDTESDDIFSSVIGPIFNQRTPHSISNITLSDDPRVLKIRTLSPLLALFDDDDDETSKTPTTETPTQTEAPTLTINYAQRRPANRGQTQKENTTRPPEWTLLRTQNKRTENIYKLLYKNPETKYEFEQILEQPVPTVPDFTVDEFNETTKRFNQLYALFENSTDDTSMSRRLYSENPRRQNRNLLMNLRPYKRDPIAPVVREHNIEKLQALASHFGLSSSVSDDLIRQSVQLYYKDRRALERTVGLMAQFVYGAQNKFLYAQKLRDRYKEVPRYQMGYSFAVLENLNLQFYMGYFSVAQFRKTKIKLSYNEEMMYMLKVYERMLRIRVEFSEICNYIRALEFERMRRERLRMGHEDEKDRIYKPPTKPSSKYYSATKDRSKNNKKK
ncbi:uncharacterized protein LOC125231620 isoform X2 [Leguminivora glycinivorella]|uniref:uncharacterized protein LOC125231620 isoform X2 n=1 Tax=Leguminivora glycinivorella TaxID=1035111 RepID=UPI00200DB121|nr:uncharacterized protein LOC125231620 isoform X2 [Leguminivora glycinivorella]